MRTLVAELKKRKYASMSRTKTKAQVGNEARRDDDPPRRRRQRGRYVSAGVRRAVFERDGNRCAYVDARGDRCRETSRLEFHHHDPFARSGAETPANLSLYCAAHNALAAVLDFGAEFATAKVSAFRNGGAARAARRSPGPARLRMRARVPLAGVLNAQRG